MILQPHARALATLALLSGIAGLPLTATAQNLPTDQCAITAGSIWQPVCKNPLTAYKNSDYAQPLTPSPYDAGRSDPGNANGPIDVWDICRYVENNSPGTSIFVPFKSAPEWQAFTQHSPANIAYAEHCSRPTILTIPPGPTCTVPPTPPPPSQPADFPYAPFDNQANPPKGVSMKVILQFACVDAGGTPWTQQATVQSTGLDSDNAVSSGFDAQHPSWSNPIVTYSTQASVNGVCGSDNGQSLSSLTPTDPNLCSTGTVANFSGSGPWSWMCDGSGGGVNASCAATVLGSWYCGNQPSQKEIERGCGSYVCDNRPMPPNQSYDSGKQWCIYGYDICVPGIECQ